MESLTELRVGWRLLVSFQLCIVNNGGKNVHHCALTAELFIYTKICSVRPSSGIYIYICCPNKYFSSKRVFSFYFKIVFPSNALVIHLSSPKSVLKLPRWRWCLLDYNLLSKCSPKYRDLQSSKTNSYFWKAVVDYYKYWILVFGWLTQWHISA